MTYFFVFAVAFVVTYLSTPSIRSVALKLSVIDKKNHRKVHKKVVTKLGGLALYFGLLAGVFVILFLNPSFFKAHFLQFGGLIMYATLVLVLGIYDDFQGSSAFIKLIIQIIAALLLIKIGFGLERIYIPSVIDINTGIFCIPLTLLWLVGITNAINLIDGLDGLATGIIAIASFFFFLYGILMKQTFIICMSLALLGACLAFLKYNFYPAKIFLGDTGSLFLGFIIGGLAIYRPGQNNNINFLFPPALVVLFLPLLDTILAIIRRVLRKQYIFASDSNHIHHYYLKLGFGHPETVVRFYLTTFFLGIFSLVIIYTYIYF